MRYLMIFRPGDGSGETDTPPTDEEIEKMGAFMGEMGGKGYLLAADGLLPSSKGSKVRKTNGEFKVTDGPFTEAKEIIAGYAVVDVPSKSVAIDIAQRFLDVANAGEEIEVRLMYDQPAFPPA